MTITRFTSPASKTILLVSDLPQIGMFIKTEHVMGVFPSPYADDPWIGLVNGELAIPGHVLRQRVFDPVLYEVTHLIYVQWARFHAKNL